MTQQPLVGLGLLIIEGSRSHSDTPHSVRLHWTSDQPSLPDNTQHSQETPMSLARFEPQSQQANGRRPTPKTARPRDSANNNNFFNGSTAPWGPRPPLSRFHDHTLDTPHSVGLFWTSGQPVTDTSTWQHTTLTRDRHPCPRRDWGDSRRAALDRAAARIGPLVVRKLKYQLISFVVSL
jgi:hypothetical protein